jgi:hypothetical protein
MNLRVDMSHLQCMYFPGETARGFVSLVRRTHETKYERTNQLPERNANERKTKNERTEVYVHIPVFFELKTK